MKKIIMLMAAMMLPALVAAEIFRSVDANGNVTFTDRPAPEESAEEVKLGPSNVVPVTKVELPPAAATEERKVAGYQRLVITSPSNEATIRNAMEPIAVTVELEPALQAGDRLVLFDNGVAQPGMQLDMPDRGAHSLVVKVLGEDGRAKISSAAVTVYIHRTSVSQQGRLRERRDGGLATVGGGASAGSGADAGGGANAGAVAPGGGAARPGNIAKPAQGQRPHPVQR